MRHPARTDRPALIACAGAERVAVLSYGELAVRSEGIAAHLYFDCGVRPGDRVGLLSANDILVPVALMALWRLGAAAVPLNPNNSVADWQFTLGNAGVRLLLTSAALASRVGELTSGLEVRTLGELAPNVHELPLDVGPDRERPAVILYTSGTTGYPKGVVLPQVGLMMNGQLMARRVGLAGTVQLAVLPLYHAHALGFGLMSALCTGGTLLFTDGLDVFNWARLIAAERVEVTSVVPHMLNMLRQAGVRADRVPTLRRLLVSSAPLSVESAAAFEDATRISLLQGWGLSEFTNFATCLPGELADDERRALLLGREWTCAGAPLDGVDVQARGPDGAELGENQEGELWVRGPCRMLGYHGDPAATAEVFSGEWLYTGDLGFWARQGAQRYFFITGRKKELIVRAADKYSPLMIERKILERVPEARGRLAVVGMKHRLYGEEVAAYLHGSAEDALAGVLKEAFSTLPVPERPKVLLCGDAPVPQTHTGKVQRRRLLGLFDAFEGHTGALKIVSRSGIADEIRSATQTEPRTEQQGDTQA